MDLYDFRRNYLMGGLSLEDLKSNPIDQFEHWMTQVMTSAVADPTAMVLATVDAQGQPNQRIVLLKQVDEQGFTFFTNQKSDKGLEIEVNSKVSLHFPWNAVERQVKVQGKAVKVSSQESDEYFASRPRESQLAACASDQSQVLASRQQLLDNYTLKQKAFADSPVPRPECWGGYRVIPESVEFWQGGEHRLHDRFVYKHRGGQWHIERLAP